MSSKINVLIPDGCSTWAMSVLSCLSYNSNYKCYVLSNTKRTATKYSRFTSYYKYYERSSDSAWLDIVLNEIEDKNISIVVPVAENEIRFCIANAEAVSKKAKLIPLPSLEMFEIAIDKYKLGEFLKSHQIAYPKFAYEANLKTFNVDQLDLKFPILFKPLHQKGGDGILRFNDVEAFSKYVKETSLDAPIFVQEYIEGFDIDCSVLCLEGNVLAHTIQKGDLKGHSPYAPQLGFNFITDDRVLELIKKTMKLMHWSGVAHIDLRYDAVNDAYKIIEINARFWGSVDGSRAVGLNFPDLAVKLASEGDIDTISAKQMHYMRLKGLLKSIKRNPLLIFKRTYILNNTEASAFFKDPLPTGFKFLEWIGRRLS